MEESHSTHSLLQAPSQHDIEQPASLLQQALLNMARLLIGTSITSQTSSSQRLRRDERFGILHGFEILMLFTLRNYLIGAVLAPTGKVFYNNYFNHALLRNYR